MKLYFIIIHVFGETKLGFKVLGTFGVIKFLNLHETNLRCDAVDRFYRISIQQSTIFFAIATGQCSTSF